MALGCDRTHSAAIDGSLWGEWTYPRTLLAPRRPSSGERDPSTAGAESFAGHEAGFLAEQEADDRGHLLRLADAPDRGLGHEARPGLVGEDPGHLGLNQAGSDAID